MLSNLMIWMVVTTLAPVSRTVEVSSSTRWVARGPGRHTSRISRVLSSYSSDQKVRSGGVGSLGGVKGHLYLVSNQIFLSHQQGIL